MRESYHEELHDINDCVVELTNSVGSAMRTATTALLDADVTLADRVIEGDQHIDAVRASVDDRCFTLLARQAPVATDLRAVTTTMATVADLERMGDLAEHIAKVARMRFPESAVPQELRPIFLDAGNLAESLVSRAGVVIAKRDVEAAAALEADDDLMDQLHKQLFRELLSPSWKHGMETAIDVTLLGRYYERFADHAVSVANRVIYLVTGERPIPVVSEA